jgi:hypothetical protein
MGRPPTILDDAIRLDMPKDIPYVVFSLASNHMVSPANLSLSLSLSLSGTVDFLHHLVSELISNSPGYQIILSVIVIV